MPVNDVRSKLQYVQKNENGNENLSAAEVRTAKMYKMQLPIYLAKNSEDDE